ncbi:ABC transporter permease subunit [Heliobacterium gestii]|uniref:ABC transporter permease subunit n=1 Tax=Heliomicrobium gestii TaxID=2699 RepID=A0A845LEU3_HELGE|nr:methionine ABC transporter permease [Heliomicrobium gestii]MBM7867688.1 D-methionine transport system permease protein [Heliomicrobium gestii]MZP44081.1 ABC transporter permease subunit [Heliomicrobium gestii]
MGNLNWQGISADLIKALAETSYMVGISMALSVVVGIPLGLLLYITEKGLFAENRLVNLLGGFAVNVIRSTPFVILLVLLLPITQRLIGTTIGPIAASVPLSVAAIAFYARLVQSSLWEVDRGVLEAADAMGAPPWMIIKDVLLSESFPGLVRGLTVTAVSLIGYSAMAGIVGGGGVGDLAIRFGYYRYETDIMLITVVALIVLVQLVQSAGDYFAKRGTK